MLHNAHNFSSTIASAENNSSPLMLRTAGKSTFLATNAIFPRFLLLILNDILPAAQTLCKPALTQTLKHNSSLKVQVFW